MFLLQLMKWCKDDDRCCRGGLQPAAAKATSDTFFCCDGYTRETETQGASVDGEDGDATAVDDAPVRQMLMAGAT